MNARLIGSLAAAVALAIAAWAPTAAWAATPTVTEFGGLAADHEPFDITAGPDGNLWFLEVDPRPFPVNTSDLVGRITPAGAVTHSPDLATNNSNPLGIAAGPDGNVWFTEEVGQFISRLTPTTPPALTTFNPPGMTVSAAPIGIVAGPDGNLWYTDARAGADVIGRFTMPPPPGPPAGQVTEFSVGGDSNPDAITVGPDGNLWFTELSTNSIGRIQVDGTVLADVPVPTPAAGLAGITVGPDGNVWFTELDANKIGRITPTTPPVVTEFPLSADPAPRSPHGIAAGPDGNLWFTERTGVGPGALARIDPATGLVTEYPSGGPDATPGLTPFAEPFGIAAGPDGNMWFTERNANTVGRINTPLDRPAHRNTAPIAIPAVGAAAPYPSEIAVAGLQGTITGVRVELTGISHAKPGEIEALLVGPQGQKALLVADVGGTSTATGGTLNLQDSGPYSMTDGGPLVSGVFKPTNGPGADSFPGPAPGGPYAENLATFNGSDPNGAWKLFVADDVALNSGTMHGGWGIDITTTGGPGGWRRWRRRRRRRRRSRHHRSRHDDHQEAEEEELEEDGEGRVLLDGGGLHLHLSAEQDGPGSLYLAVQGEVEEGEEQAPHHRHRPGRQQGRNAGGREVEVRALVRRQRDVERARLTFTPSVCAAVFAGGVGCSDVDLRLALRPGLEQALGALEVLLALEGELERGNLIRLRRSRPTKERLLRVP